MRTVIIFIFIISSSFVFGQKNGADFPKAFVGNWKGKILEFKGKATRELMMTLKITPTDTVGQYIWQINCKEIHPLPKTDPSDLLILGPNPPDLLKPVNISEGHWAVYTETGLVIDYYVHGNSVTGSFSIQRTMDVIRFRLENGRILVEFFNIDKGIKTSENKFYIGSYEVTDYSSGILEKQPQ